MNGVADGTLARQAAAGDRAAFAALYDRFNAEIYGFSVRMLSNRSDAADVTQDVFVRAIEKLPQLREPDRVRAWLFTIARHECFARTKRRSRTMATDPLDLGADMASTNRSTAGLVEANELTQLVWDAAKGLAPEDRAVLDLKLKRDLDGADLAEALGVPHDQLHKVTGRAMERFERSIVSLVLARGARRDCSVLAGLVETDDVELTPVLRKRIARHAQDCDACERRRKILVNPSTMVASAHEVGPSLALRDQVLQAAFSHSFTGTSAVRSLSWGADGFPKARGTKRKLITLAAVGGVLIGGVFASGVGSENAPKPTVVMQSNSIDSTAAPTSSSAIPPTIRVSSSTILSGSGAVVSISTSTSSAPTTTNPQTSLGADTTAPTTTAPTTRASSPLRTTATAAPTIAFKQPVTTLLPKVLVTSPSIPLSFPSVVSTPTIRKPKLVFPTTKPRTTTPRPVSVVAVTSSTALLEIPASTSVEVTVPISTGPPIIYPESVAVDPSRSATTVPSTTTTQPTTSAPVTASTTPVTTVPIVVTPPTTTVTQPPITTTTIRCALTQSGCGSPAPSTTTTTAIPIRLVPVCCVTIKPGILFATTTQPPILIK